MRLFIAIMIPQTLFPYLQTLQQYAVDLGAKEHLSIRMAVPDQCHITLRFLGECDETAVPRLKVALDETARAHNGFQISFDRLGYFQGRGNPLVLWSSVGEGREALITFAETLGTALDKQGFPKETREFRPHLTLGRLKHGKPSKTFLHALTLAPGIPATPVPVTSVTLVQSILHPTGPVYKEIHVTSLRLYPA